MERDLMTPTPSNLRITPGVGSLAVTWSVSTSEGLGGFLLHWRAQGLTTWSTVMLAATARSYALTGLQAETYEVSIRALTAGGLASGSGTPLEALPPPPPPPSGEVLWTAETVDKWANVQAQSAERIKQVVLLDTGDGPAPPGGRCLRIEVHDGDNFYGERAELGMANPVKPGFPTYGDGDDRAIALQILIPPSFPLAQSSWSSIMQIHQEQGNGPPPFKLEARSGKLVMVCSLNQIDVGGTASHDVWSAPITTGRWLKLVIVAHFSNDPSKGYFDLYGDLDGNGVKHLFDQPAPSLMVNSDGSLKRDFSTIGLYRNSSISGTAHVYYAGWTLAKDRATAESVAFN